MELVETELETLAAGAVAGDARAWRALWSRPEPLVWGLTGRAAACTRPPPDVRRTVGWLTPSRRPRQWTVRT